MGTHSRFAETDLDAPLPAAVQEAESEARFDMSSALSLLSPYCLGPGRFKNAAYAASHFVFMGLGIYVDVILTQWHGAFWNVFQTKDSLECGRLLLDFVIITSVSVCAAAYDQYLVGMWDLHMRDHMTQHFRHLWIKDGVACRIKNSVQPLDNPDQRIHEDVAEFGSSTRDLVFGSLTAFSKVAIFGPLLIS